MSWAAVGTVVYLPIPRESHFACSVRVLDVGAGVVYRKPLGRELHNKVLSSSDGPLVVEYHQSVKFNSQLVHTCQSQVKALSTWITTLTVQAYQQGCITKLGQQYQTLPL